MGYYVTLTDADFKIPADKLDDAYKALCALNNKNHLKTGGRSPRPDPLPEGPNEYIWFSWMDWNYHETCPDLAAILTQIGFELSIDDDGSINVVGYDNKTGNEQIFLHALAPFVGEAFLEWEGEQREVWRFSYMDGTIWRQHAESVWSDPIELFPEEVKDLW